MIAGLKVNGFVLLDGVDLELGPGLTVLSGGSGEGKTVLLSALRFAFGEGSGGKSAARRLIRRGAQQASVEVALRARRGTPLAQLLRSLGSGLEARVTRVIQRTGRGRCKLNGEPLPLVQVRAIGRAATEIFGQGDAQHLVDPERQLALLDAYGGLRDKAAEVERRRDGVRALRAEQEALLQAEARARESHDGRSQVRRVLSELDPAPGELDQLRERRDALEARALRQQNLARLVHMLSDGDGALLDQLYDAAHDLDSLGVLPKAAAELEEAAALVEGVATAVRREHDAVERDASLEHVRLRLSEFRSAAQRLGTAPERLASLWEETQAALDPETLAARRVSVERALTQEQAALAPLVKALTRARTKSGAKLSKAVCAQLPALGMGGAGFRVTLAATASGADAVRFGFAAHPDADPAGLEQASGGELARLFLAIGLEVAGRADERLLVFDEVDQNVGARLGAAVGACLKGIAQGRQVLTITHLAPVAARAACHLKVTKVGQRAGVAILEGDARIDELALMIRGEPLTQASREQARELLAEAQQEPGIRRRRRVHAA